MIVAGAASAPPSNAMSPVAMASVVAGSAVFLALMTLVAHASYKRKKEHDWHVAEWHRAESEAWMQRRREQQQQQKDQNDREMLH